jgi:archaemetzincin
MSPARHIDCNLLALMTTEARGAIALAPVGASAIWYFDRLSPILEDTFRRPVTVAPPLPLPDDALHAGRGQYTSSALLDVLAHAMDPGWERLLGIVDVDLCAPGLSFVFGEADVVRGAAVMSIWRLQSGRDIDSFVRLAATEAVHEIGHTYRLRHCRDPRCVMWFSNTLGESERKGYRFCADHAAELSSTI